MTNLGHTSPIVGSRGRRASVATDKPVDLPPTSLRGTMERQRSPRGSIVPDIALDMGNDVEAINHKPLLERDQYGDTRNAFNQKMSRSPRNSLVPDDYYRTQRNGIRSPRNSLVPETSLAPDMLYSSRHSLVPEAPLSPRNSLVPDVAHNRSPRNSLVPLTGSRTSLMSENGNAPPPRSPRHSLIPNSSRSPRGSITNMELVDRSPQRSPRGSIASECLNQSPRSSIVPYEMNRSSRGSIGVNDTPRGSILINEEEARSPRRSIDPDTIDRTPRGSLGGLQERRATKASLVAQDPRRASADQGTINENRNSSPSRQKEVNSGSVKSRGSGVQINLGYGGNTFEDSRRASSSVSQFSGDESRRLFTSGAKLPENTMENRNPNYGSVVFQLKDANLEANNICDFVFRGLKVVCRTRVVTVCLMCLSMLPILMLIHGECGDFNGHFHGILEMLSFEFLERLPEGAKNTDVHGDRRDVWKHAHGVAYLLADTLKETRNDLRPLDQTTNLIQEIDHHRLIVLPVGMVRDGKLLDTSHHVATVHVLTAHSERPLSQDSLSVLVGTSSRDIRHFRDHAARDNRAGVLQNPGMPATRKRDRICDVSLNRTVESSNCRIWLVRFCCPLTRYITVFSAQSGARNAFNVCRIDASKPQAILATVYVSLQLQKIREEEKKESLFEK
ncbi:hypothetical protein K0M31_017522, partial [Melipona bicolor]